MFLALGAAHNDRVTQVTGSVRDPGQRTIYGDQVEHSPPPLSAEGAGRRATRRRPKAGAQQQRALFFRGFLSLAPLSTA